MLAGKLLQMGFGPGTNWSWSSSAGQIDKLSCLRVCSLLVFKWLTLSMFDGAKTFFVVCHWHYVERPSTEGPNTKRSWVDNIVSNLHTDTPFHLLLALLLGVNSTPACNDCGWLFFTVHMCTRCFV